MNEQEAEVVKIPEPGGPYSPAVVVDKWIIVSGQLGLDPSSGIVVTGGVAAETAQAMSNISAVLESVGADLSSLVKTTIYLTSMEDFAVMNEAYARALGDSRPARATVGVNELARSARVEIEAWAYVQ